jgi:regulator of replication initiation timing
MFGNQAILNRILSEKPDSPIYPEGDVSVLRIIEVMFDEQWKELGRQYQFCEETVITVPHLGKWEVRNSQLRKYIRENIKQIRKLRNRLKKLIEENPDYDVNNSMTVMLEQDLVLKTRVAWKQLDNIRHTWIKKDKIWKERKQNSIKAQMSTKIDNK